MKDPDFKQHGKEINKIMGKIMLNVGKFSVPFKTQKIELGFWKQTQNLLKNKFLLNLTIENETSSKELKKSQALPGKPAILIK